MLPEIQTKEAITYNNKTLLICNWNKDPLTGLPAFKESCAKSPRRWFVTRISKHLSLRPKGWFAGSGAPYIIHLCLQECLECQTTVRIYPFFLNRLNQIHLNIWISILLLTVVLRETLENYFTMIYPSIFYSVKLLCMQRWIWLELSLIKHFIQLYNLYCYVLLGHYGLCF